MKLPRSLGYVKKSKLNKKINNQHKLTDTYGKLLWIIYPLLLVIMIQILGQGLLISSLLFPFSNFFYFLFNLILVVWLGAILLILTENKWIALNILNGITFIIALGSRITFYNTDNGLALSNLKIFNELKLLENTPGSVYIVFFLIALVFLLILNLMIYFMYNWRLGLKRKLPIAVFSLMIFIVFSQFLTPKITNLANKTFDVKKQGIILFFNNGILPFNSIDYPGQKEVLAIKNGLLAEEKNTEIKPNIIYVQLPNFVDITKMTQLEQDPLVNYHSIFTDGIYLYSDITTAEKNSLNLEFEVLSGLPSEWYPYEVQVRGDNLPEESIGLGSILKADDYLTYSITPESKSDNSRESFYEKLGFEEIITLEELKSDDPENILENIRNTLTSNPKDRLFIYTSLKVMKDSYKGDVVNNYSEDLKKLDSYIGKLKETISLNTTPTVMVFYTSKLPVLGENNSFYRDVGYIGEKKGIEEDSKLNQGNILIWNNYNKTGELKNDQKMDLSQLSARTLNYIGLNMPDYFYYFKELATVDGVHSYNEKYLGKNSVLYSAETETYKTYIKEINVVVKDILGPNKYFEKNKNRWIAE